MRYCNKTFHIRLTEKDYATLCKNSERAGLPKTTYIRFMIKGQAPMDKPPVDYFNLMQEMYKVGNNLNQIARMFHQFKNIRYRKLEEALEQLYDTIMKIKIEVRFPENLDIDSVLKNGKKRDELERKENGDM